MPVITFSGNLGSGAREIAQDVARELGLDYVDHEILAAAAHQLGVPVAAVERRDERARSMSERLGSLLRTLMERSAASTDPLSGAGLDVVLERTYGEAVRLPDAAESELDEKRYLATLTSVISELAARDNVVILGRGGQAILRDATGTVHIYVWASKRHRIDMLEAREGVAPEEAKRRIKESDQHRAAFHERFFHVDAEDPSLYDLMVNAGRIGHPVAVALVVEAVRAAARPGKEPADVPQP
jgi:cytidylate kinase